MKTIKDHQDIVSEIADDAFRFGIDKSGIDFSGITSLDQLPSSERIKFIQTCHEGYRLAQNKLIDEIIYYQDIWNELKVKLKDARKKKDKDIEIETISKINIVTHRLSTLTHIGDGIAWAIISQQLHVARRLYIREKGIKILKQSNIELSIKVANEINKDPDNFALISDITSIVQIGDLLVMNKGKVGIMELKSGIVNKQIQTFLSDSENKTDAYSHIYEEAEFDIKTKKQLERVVRQKKRAINFANLIEDDQGIDPASGENMKIHTPIYHTEYYHNELNSILEGLKEKIWSYNVIENCLHIGAYKETGIAMAPVVIKALLENNAENYIIIDWMSITNQVAEPIFFKPIQKEIMIGILTGSIKVIMGLNLDKMLELFESHGLKGEWMTEKETMRIKQKSKAYLPFTLKKRGLKFKYNDLEIIASGGIFSKIFFDNIKPSSIAVSLMHNKL